MNKYLKFSLWTAGIIVTLFFVLYVIAYFYVSSHKKEILTEISQQISEKLDGEVEIKNVDLSFLKTFPQISVLLQNVSVKDTLFASHKKPFFTAEKLFVRISVFQVIAKKDPLTGLRIDDGNLYIFTDTSGYTNAYLLKGKQTDKAARPTAAKRTILDDIRLNNFNITVKDEIKNKWLEYDVNKLSCDIDDKDSVLAVKIKSDVHIKSMAFNLDAGSYLEGKTMTGNFNFAYNQRSKLLYFKNIHLKIDKQPYTVSGRFSLNQNPQFRLAVAAKNLDFNEGKSLLPKKIAMVLSRYAVSKPLQINAIIDGPLSQGKPLVLVDWKASPNTTVSTPFFTFDNCNFTGGYTNEMVKGQPREDPNSRVIVRNFTGTWEGIPLRSDKAYIDNLTIPNLQMDLHSDFTLPVFNNVLQSNSIKLKSGAASLNIVYSGPLAKNSNRNTNINGSFVITNGQMLYTPRNITLNNCNGAIVFNKTDVSVKNLRTVVLGNTIVMNGSLRNMLGLLKDNPGKVLMDWSIYSPGINLATITSLLQKRKNVTATAAGQSKFGSPVNRLDDMLEESNVNLSLIADKMQYKKFTATNVKARVELVQDSWDLKNVSFNSSGGSMQLNGWLHGKNDAFQNVNLGVNVIDADVNKILYAFDNFGQDGISYANLQGKLNSKVKVNLDLPRDLSANPQNMDGNISFSLKNGALVNYEPLKKLQIFLLKNRNFNDVRFAELKDDFEVKGKDIIMKRMEIQSTVMTLFVEGLFSMEPGKTDISIQVPLSNLKKRDDDYKPKNKGADTKAGPSVYVRGRPGDDGNIKFKLDVFKKFRRDKNDKDNQEKDETE